MTDNIDNTTRTVKTKYRATEKTSHKTVVTFDWTGCTVEDLIPFAEPNIVIGNQTLWRDDVIPANVTIVVRDWAARERKARGPINIVAAFERMSPEEQRAFLDKQIARLAAAT